MEQARIDAARAGSKTYFGKTCPKHPKSPRYVVTGRCQQCDIDKAARRYEETKEILAKARADGEAIKAAT